MNEEKQAEVTALRMTRTLNAPAERAFRVFTERADAWWPREHRLGEAERTDLIIEPHTGGRWYERCADGAERDWGKVLLWDPPHRLVLSWQIAVGFLPETDPSRASHIDIRFVDDGPGRSTLTLEHSEFERHGEEWHSMRDAVASGEGWPGILDAFAGTAGRPSPEDQASEPYGTITAPGTIRFERLLPGPVERIWAYLTDSEKRGKWLAPGVMDLREGGQVELKFRHSDLSAEPTPERYKKYEGSMYGRITQCDPPRLLSYTWGEDSGEDSEVTFELVPQGDSVRLVVTHRKLGEDRALILSVAGGWHTHLGILTDHLSGLEPRGFWSTHERIEAEYAQRLAPAAKTAS